MSQNSPEEALEEMFKNGLDRSSQNARDLLNAMRFRSQQSEQPQQEQARSQPDAQAAFHQALAWAQNDPSFNYQQWGQDYRNAPEAQRQLLQGELVQLHQSSAAARTGVQEHQGQAATHEASARVLREGHPTAAEGEDEQRARGHQQQGQENRAQGTGKEREANATEEQVHSVQGALSEQEQTAQMLRAHGAPEQGIQAKIFADSQQRHTADHAARGQGQTAGKTKGQPMQQVREQGRGIRR